MSGPVQETEMENEIISAAEGLPTEDAILDPDPTGRQGSLTEDQPMLEPNENVAGLVENAMRDAVNEIDDEGGDGNEASENRQFSAADDNREVKPLKVEVFGSNLKDAESEEVDACVREEAALEECMARGEEGYSMGGDGSLIACDRLDEMMLSVSVDGSNEAMAVPLEDIATEKTRHLATGVDGTNGALTEEEERVRDLRRAADVKEDLHQMEARARVSQILTSAAFREELEEIIDSQLKSGPHPSTLIALQQVSQLILPQSSSAHSGILAAAASATGRSAVLPIADIRGMNSTLYTKGERLMRCKLSSLYRLVDMYGWSQGIYNHITARLSQSHEHFLINAFGLLYHEVTAGSLVKIDMQGNVVDPGNTNLGVNKAGFYLHSAIHAARPDLRCIIHVHTPPAITVSIMKHGLLPLTPESVSIGEVSYHDYEGVVVHEGEMISLARDLGPVNKVMFLRHHGLVACGETMEEAFSLLLDTMRACEVQSKLVALGPDGLIMMSEAAQHAVREQAREPRLCGGRKWRKGEMEFEAHMRMMDNSGYRTGYIYRQPIVRQQRKEKLTSDVEYPSSTSALQYYEDADLSKSPLKDAQERQRAAQKTDWLNTPNVYKKEELEEFGTSNPQKIVKWVPDADSPGKQATPYKVQNRNQFAPQGSNPKEFLTKQKLIRADYYEDKVHAGPQSKIVEGSTWEDAARMKDAYPSGTGEQIVVVGAASRGIIKRAHQHNATVFKSRFATNPFDNVDTEELARYTKKAQGEKDGVDEEDGVPATYSDGASPAPSSPAPQTSSSSHAPPDSPTTDPDHLPPTEFKRAASERYPTKAPEFIENQKHKGFFRSKSERRPKKGKASKSSTDGAVNGDSTMLSEGDDSMSPLKEKKEKKKKSKLFSFSKKSKDKSPKAQTTV